jgi:glycolate oxidase FAD binding subunit
MKISSETLAANLQSELGANAVTLEPLVLSTCAVDGKAPTIVGIPSGSEQVSAALRMCAEGEASVVPRGGGVFMALGNIPRHVDVVIKLDKLDGLVEHDEANLTATVQAGMKLSSLQGLLKQRGQFLTIDAPHSEHVTIGGLVAANTNGPRRMSYGAVRDLVIGMKMVLATGEQIKAGGKVVKNVAGYDMCKLFVGSLGTLGIITEVTFKLAPLPEESVTLVAQGSLAQCVGMTEELAAAALLPAAVTVFNADAATAQGFQTRAAAIAVWVEGFTEAVKRHLVDLQSAAERMRLDFEVLSGQPHRSLWKQICGFGVDGISVLCRMTVPMASIRNVLTTIDEWGQNERPAQIIAHPGTGTVWAQTIPEPETRQWLLRLSALAQAHNGHAVVFAAPPECKEGIDVWGTPPAALNIMREIKKQFDPQGILSPGRFVAGL